MACEERLVLATGRYLGEGFDDASLDTLFLTMPISWCGTLAQYVVRLHREHHAKREIIVYDYVDSGRAAPRPHGAQAPDWVSQPRLRNFDGSRSCDDS
jgi:superfamily II DNA or RNA helicase